LKAATSDRSVATGRRDGFCDRDGFADGLYWVVGNRATNKCEIVTSNPIVIGDIWFEDRPYKSLDDAKLARSTIGACPKDDPSAHR
jgi:hypothetical protein